MTNSPPVAALSLWDQLIRACAGRCQCTGQCGSKHKSGAGRCEHENGGYVSKHTGPIRLLVAPAEPEQLARPVHLQVGLPTSALAAWCPPCHDAARARAQREHCKALAEQLTDATNALF